MKGKERISGPNADADDLFVMIQQARTKDPSSKYIHAIRAAPNTVIAAECQVNDMVHFSTGSKFGIVTADPTFTLGDFDATLIIYRHHLLETKQSKKTPVFWAQYSFTIRKPLPLTYCLCHDLLGCLSAAGRCQSIWQTERMPWPMRWHEFGFAQHLTCFIYYRRNVKDKLADCNFPSELAHKILDDNFGRKLGSVFNGGHC